MWDWNAVGAIGQWAGATATFAAVLVALGAERRARRTRLSVEVSLGPTPAGRGGPDVIVGIVNLSGRPVFLDSGGTLLPDRRQLGPVTGVDEIGALPDTERRECRVPARTLAKWLSDSGFPNAVNLRFVIEDTTGGRHECRSVFDPGPWLAARAKRRASPAVSPGPPTADEQAPEPPPDEPGATPGTHN